MLFILALHLASLPRTSYNMLILSLAVMTASDLTSQLANYLKYCILSTFPSAILATLQCSLLGCPSFPPLSITLAGILEQPRGTTAVVSGLNYITRIFALLGEILVRIRVDKRAPPHGTLATDRLAEIRALHTRIINALAHAPAPLKLKSGGGVGPGVGSPGAGFGNAADYGGLGSRHATFLEVRNFFHDPNASRVNAGNAFLVMQANLYVTQVRHYFTLKCVCVVADCADV